MEQYFPSLVVYRSLIFVSVLLVATACGGVGGSSGSGTAASSTGATTSAVSPMLSGEDSSYPANGTRPPGGSVGSVLATNAFSESGEAEHPVAPLPADGWQSAYLAQKLLTDFLIASATAAAPKVTVALSASSTLIDTGTGVRLTWRTSGASSCTASGGWSGWRSTHGTQAQAILKKSTDYWLSCTDVRGRGAVAGVSVKVRSKKSLRIDFKAEPATVLNSQQSVLTWTAHDATKCSSNGSWTGNRPVQGRFDTGALSKRATYSLECSNVKFTELVTVSVEVKNQRIEWASPQTNEDGSKATDLAGYRVYWGTSPSTMGGEVTIRDPKQTFYEPDLPRGKYYFAVAAFDRHGNESEKSGAIMKEIP